MSSQQPSSVDNLNRTAADVQGDGSNRTTLAVKRFAAATAGAAADLAAKVASLPAPTPPPPTDERRVLPGQSIQAVIDAAPHGALIRLAAGVHRPSAPIDTSQKSGLRIEGEGGIGYNEDANWGTVIRPTFTGPCFQDLGGGAQVKHAGPAYRWLNVRSDAAYSTAFKFRNVNHVSLVDCSIKGLYARAIDGDVPVSEYPNGDHAYNTLERVWIVNSQPDAAGFVQGDGFWWLHIVNFDMTGTSPVALQNLRGNISASQIKSNHAGIHFYSSGNSSDITGWKFEQAPYTGAFMVVCEKGSNLLPGAGCNHKFMSCTFTPHDDAWLPGAKIARFGAGTYGNSLPRAFNATAYDKPVGSFVDDSGKNTFEPHLA
jgi:hypothetical protein